MTERIGFDRKHCKERARKNLKEHYFFFVIACMLAAFTGAAYTTSLSGIEATKIYSGDSAITIDKSNTTSIGRISIDGVITEILEGNEEKAGLLAEKTTEELKNNEIKIGGLSFGNGTGILSSLINTVSSGTVFVAIFKAITTITKSTNAAIAVFIGLIALVYVAIMIFVKDTFIVAFKRIFMESYAYEKVKANRFLFLFRVKRALKACFTMLLTNIYLALWSLTIVGGFIKHYSYMLVPYIIAENPDISKHEAIKLSRDLMDGNKWEAFKIDLSFIGWYILSAFTLGLLSILYVNPYIECVKTEFYFYLRRKGQKAGIKNADLLNDTYLYKKATKEEIDAAYKDIYEIMNDDIHLEDCKHTGVRGFFEDNFGVIAKYDEDEDKYNVAIEQEVKIRDFKYIMALKAYPGRLFPIAEKEKEPRLDHSHYMRHYSIWSLIALFFIFAFIGWSWEVSLHLIEDGVFVNRGTMQGPWLPIYGFGGFFIVQLLYRFRSKPGVHTIATIILCGVLEYVTHWVLEVTKGTKWWDYSGYFLNLNGRICAEGLLVFALGGTAIVYALAPIIDNQLRKVNQKRLKIVCTILVIIWSCDFVYSWKHPNTGKGITDYGEQSAYIVNQGNL